jgi:hypothetical protein
MTVAGMPHHDEHARWAIGAILTAAAERADVDAFRAAMHRVRPRVTSLLEHLLGLDDLVDFCLSGIGLRILQYRYARSGARG